MVSHDPAKGFAACSHLLILSRGRIAAFDEKGRMGEDGFSQLYREIVGEGVA